ncbi:MAG: fatty acid desaturase [Cyanothece sp. SIO2G6]|nr:fatty acid desaturase [Cyanothece sp. SIO2G6]
MPYPSTNAASPTDSLANGLEIKNPHRILSANDLRQLNQRSNLAGSVQFAAHLGLIIVAGYLGAIAPGWWALPALMIQGAGLALMFATVHECSHRTAFANRTLNDWAAWIGGVLSFYNSTFYRHYHKWHHRYTQIPGKDPELDDPKPETRLQYLWQLSGIPWWIGKIKGHVQVLRGNVADCYFLPESGYGAVMRSTRWQFGVYGAIALISTLLGHPWFLVLHWVLPLAIGQPLLRFLLLAEHTGCTHDDNYLTNTRTTLTLWPLRLLMWNLPYHAEHHLYPSIPFHALAPAHLKLSGYVERVDPGYIYVHRTILAGLGERSRS